MGLCHSEEKRPEVKNRTIQVTPISRTHEQKDCQDESEIRKEVDQIFDKYDFNRDGVLEKDEVMGMIQDMHRDHNARASWGHLEEYVNSFMLRADSKQKGKIDKEDFYNYYKGK